MVYLSQEETSITVSTDTVFSFDGKFSIAVIFVIFIIAAVQGNTNDYP